MECHAHLLEACVRYPLRASTFLEGIDELIDLATEAKLVDDPAVLKAQIREREVHRHTFIGSGFALPRAAVRGVSEYFIAVGKFATPVPMNTGVHRSPLQFIVLFAAPTPKNVTFLKTYMCLTACLGDAEKRERLIRATDQTDLYRRLTEVFEL